MSDKPKVLVLGGVGFIGRNLVDFLVTNKLVSFIRVADKSLPAASYFNERHKAAFDQKDIVEFKQCDLSRDQHVVRAFENVEFDFVVNLCGETRFGLSEGDYKQRSLEPAIRCAKAAVASKVKKFIEVSTAQVYKPGKKASSESDDIEPWTMQAKYRLEAEGAVCKTEGLPWVVLRPPYVYGEGDLTSITPRITCAAVYQDLKEVMKFLWDESLVMDVVHVNDLVNAIWCSCTQAQPGKLYNLSEPGHLNQGELNGMLGKLFHVEVGFQGSLLSNLAKMNLSSVAAMANDKHVPGWTKICQEHKIINTPLSPYIDKELLYNNSLAVDGSKITKDTSFKYSFKISIDLLREVVVGFQKQGIFPMVKIA